MVERQFDFWVKIFDNSRSIFSKHIAKTALAYLIKSFSNRSLNYLLRLISIASKICWNEIGSISLIYVRMISLLRPAKKWRLVWKSCIPKIEYQVDLSKKMKLLDLIDTDTLGRLLLMIILHPLMIIQCIRLIQVGR